MQTSHISGQTGVETSMWILSNVLGKKGPIHLDCGINKHQFEPFDELCDDFVIGKKSTIITINECKIFLRKLNTYAMNEKFDNGRSYFFEGIEKTGIKKYAFRWGS
jgi:hypothetical protein